MKKVSKKCEAFGKEKAQYRSTAKTEAAISMVEAQ